MEKNSEEWVSLEGWQQQASKDQVIQGPRTQVLEPRTQAALDLVEERCGLIQTPDDLLPSRVSLGISVPTSSSSLFC